MAAVETNTRVPRLWTLPLEDLPRIILPPGLDPAERRRDLALTDDLTAECGPYDDQVMYCRRRLAECILQPGRRDEAVDRLMRLQGQMDARYGGGDRRVREPAELIENIRR